MFTAFAPKPTSRTETKARSVEGVVERIGAYSFGDSSSEFDLLLENHQFTYTVGLKAANYRRDLTLCQAGDRVRFTVYKDNQLGEFVNLTLQARMDKTGV